MKYIISYILMCPTKSIIYFVVTSGLGYVIIILLLIMNFFSSINVNFIVKQLVVFTSVFFIISRILSNAMKGLRNLGIQ